jgi:hypothetical protein
MHHQHGFNESDYNPYAEANGRGFGAARTVAMVGALALIATPAVTAFVRRWRTKREVARTEPEIDKTLKDTFPASDPPASRYFDIPENRQ